MTTEYWDSVYTSGSSDNVIVNTPSTFALWCSKFIRFGDKLIDLGCGNGRDSAFFGKVCHVTSIDKSFEAINNIKLLHPEIETIVGDLGDIANLVDTKFDVAYSRFSLHAIDEEQQGVLLDWVSSNCKLFCLETRSIHDPRYGIGKWVGKDAFVDTHYRRFTSITELVEEMYKRGMSVVHSEEDYHSAIYNCDRAVVNRIVVRCKN